MAELRECGALGFTDDGKPVHRAGILRKALQYQKLVGGIIALHEEDPTLSGKGVMHEGVVSARLGLAGIPSISESTLIARDAAIARYEDGRIHIQHLSARESVEAIAEAKARGVQITCEASPHHLTLTDESVAEKLDTRLKMNPPLRTEDDRQALIQGLKDGTIDCIATDHAPHAREEKEVPFEQAPMGTTGLETSFAAVYTANILPLALIVEKLTAGAALMDLPTPEIAVGRAADLVLIDLDAEWEVGAQGYESRSENCCFAGRRLKGKVLTTIAAGGIVYRERVLDGRMSAYVLLEDGTRFDGESVGAPVLGDRRGRLHDRHVGLPGVDDRPQLRAPADHLHDRARRQLRRLRAVDGVRPHPRGRRDHARRGRLRRRARRRAGLAELAARPTASRASPAWTRARSCATSAPRAACAAGSSPPTCRSARPASGSTPSRAWSAATSRAR